MNWLIAICCVVSIPIIVIFGLAFVKSRGANSNYTEFAMDEYNHPMTWRDRGDYE